jgi:hypothetical protein
MVHPKSQPSLEEEKLMSTIDQLSNCHPVAEAHWFMERLAFLERRSMEILSVWIWNTPHLDSKLSFGLHAYEDATHADLCFHRAKELQPGLPSYGWKPRPLNLAGLDLICREVAQAVTLPCKLSGLYGSLKPWLLSRYEEYLQAADPILEGPTVRILRRIIEEERLQIVWAKEWLEKQGEIDSAAREEAEQWRRRIAQSLGNLVDLASDPNGQDWSSQPLTDFTGQPPACDPRLNIVFYTPGQGPSAPVEFDPQNETEIQQVMLSTLVVVETEAAEVVGRILVEFPDLPWQMRFDLCRQMWDECRHAASQWRLLRHLGADLGVHPSIAYINLFVGDEPDVLKRLIVLQRVVEGVSVDQHRPRGRYFLKEGIYPLVQMFDYILADEDNHIGLSSWIRVIAGKDQKRLDELARYQAIKEQEYSDYSDWLISKRRDLARLYPPAKTGGR